jgi:uncharacterized Tic20 family protein
MSEQVVIKQDERMLAGLAHGSIFLGPFTGGIGGIVAALVIWLTQREKSAYVTGQALQALAYQALTFLVTMAVWCCWGLLWLVSILQPLITNPEAYDNAPPAGLWVGLILMFIPLGVWGLTILYGLYGAARSFSGHDFKYIVIGNWLESQK